MWKEEHKNEDRLLIEDRACRAAVWIILNTIFFLTPYFELILFMYFCFYMCEFPGQNMIILSLENYTYPIGTKTTKYQPLQKVVESVRVKFPKQINM